MTKIQKPFYKKDIIIHKKYEAARAIPNAPTPNSSCKFPALELGLIAVDEVDELNKELVREGTVGVRDVWEMEEFVFTPGVVERLPVAVIEGRVGIGVLVVVPPDVTRVELGVTERDPSEREFDGLISMEPKPFKFPLMEAAIRLMLAIRGIEMDWVESIELTEVDML